MLADKIGPFTTMPNWIIEKAPEIGSDGLVLLLALRYFSGANELIFPSYETLQEKSGLTRRRISQAIKRLEGLGILSRRKRFGKTTLYKIENLYTPDSRTDGRQMDANSRPKAERPVVQGVDCIRPGGAREQESINKTESQQEEVKEASTTPDSMISTICEITGLSYIPPKQMEYIEPLLRLQEDYSLKQLKEVLTRNYQKWITTSRKSGNGMYNPLNFGWVDWAQAELIGQPAGPIKTYADMTQDERFEYLLQGGTRYG